MRIPKTSYSFPNTSEFLSHLRAWMRHASGEDKLAIARILLINSKLPPYDLDVMLDIILDAQQNISEKRMTLRQLDE